MAKSFDKVAWRAGKRAEVKGLMVDLQKGIQRLSQTPEEWRCWLDQQAKFHHYSFRNCVLIWSQNRQATQVAGYCRWQDLRRQVRAGEKSIKILGPLIKKTESRDGDDTEELYGFQALSVFDIAQTDGELLPEHKSRLQGQEYAPLLGALTKVAESKGRVVTFANELGNGHTDGHDVWVDQNMDPNMQAKTLAHELAHCDLEHVGHMDDHGLGEMEAESVAYVVCGALGFDTSAWSMRYIASWMDANPSTSEAVMAALKESAGHIAKVAKAIIEEVLGQDEPVAQAA